MLLTQTPVDSSLNLRSKVSMASSQWSNAHANFSPEELAPLETPPAPQNASPKSQGSLGLFLTLPRVDRGGIIRQVIQSLAVVCAQGGVMDRIVRIGLLLDQSLQTILFHCVNFAVISTASEYGGVFVTAHEVSVLPDPIFWCAIPFVNVAESEPGVGSNRQY